MRPFALLGWLAASGAALAQQGFLGTKPEPAAATGPTAPVGPMPVLQMAVALAIVVAVIKFALPWGVRRFGKRLVTKVDSPIRVEETATCGVGTLHVVTVRGRTLLLASGPQGTNLIADLTEQPTQPKTFLELVDEAEPATPMAPTSAVVEAPDPEDEKGHLAEMIQRLERLAG
ncbi:MAG: flagellar biosynthetic protein FliO [Fimbriimonadales bacterium]|nr:flagellar biosynthetic protein FliO [Fimbriimonadales bacterium]